MIRKEDSRDGSVSKPRQQSCSPQLHAPLCLDKAFEIIDEMTKEAVVADTELLFGA